MKFAAPKNIILSAHVDMLYVTFNNQSANRMASLPLNENTVSLCRTQQLGEILSPGKRR